VKPGKLQPPKDCGHLASPVTKASVDLLALKIYLDCLSEEQ